MNKQSFVNEFVNYAMKQENPETVTVGDFLKSLNSYGTTKQWWVNRTTATWGKTATLCNEELDKKVAEKIKKANEAEFKIIAIEIAVINNMKDITTAKHETHITVRDANTRFFNLLNRKLEIMYKGIVWEVIGINKETAISSTLVILAFGELRELKVTSSLRLKVCDEFGVQFDGRLGSFLSGSIHIWEDSHSTISIYVDFKLDYKTASAEIDEIGGYSATTKEQREEIERENMHIKAGLNWPGCGTTGLAEAQQFIEALQTAQTVVSKFENVRYV